MITTASKWYGRWYCRKSTDRKHRWLLQKKEIAKKLPVISDKKWSCCFQTSTWQCLYCQSLGFNQHITIILFSLFFFAKQHEHIAAVVASVKRLFLIAFVKLRRVLFFFSCLSFLLYDFTHGRVEFSLERHQSSATTRRNIVFVGLQSMETLWAAKQSSRKQCGDLWGDKKALQL